MRLDAHGARRAPLLCHVSEVEEEEAGQEEFQSPGIRRGAAANQSLEWEKKQKQSLHELLEQLCRDPFGCRADFWRVSTTRAGRRESRREGAVNQTAEQPIRNHCSPFRNRFLTSRPLQGQLVQPFVVRAEPVNEPVRGAALEVSRAFSMRSDMLRISAHKFLLHVREERLLQPEHKRTSPSNVKKYGNQFNVSAIKEMNKIE